MSEHKGGKMKECYRLGECLLYYGDCLSEMNKIRDGSVDMVLCDLPYGTTQCKWDVRLPFEQLWKQYLRVVKENGAIVLFGTEPFSSLLRLSNLKLFKYDWIWDKVKGTGFLNAKKQPLRNHEIISVFYKKQCHYHPQKTTGHQKKKSFRAKHHQSEVYGKMTGESVYESTERYPRSIQRVSSDTQISSLHPTQKPIQLLEYLIRTYTDLGQTVLDNCMGSGSTGVACQNTGRKFIGIEKDKKYFNIAINRITGVINSRDY
ncbi:DNA-methyltransferase [Chryseobacterium sp. 22543]|uniref:DNA-methyltransferase n=1 Tax=Chryseobacterium sp. 22543 TaxID=3453940 RepID=UPI003F855F91